MANRKSARENPVWMREWRGRWRRPITPIAIFGYAAILAVFVGAYFAANIAGTVATHDQTGLRGQDLLVWLARVQMVLASLFAAALAAPAIAAERHSGTLAMLRLSPLSSKRIVGGKFASSALVVMLLILVPLPMNSLAFVLGGVSLPDFLAVALMQCAVVSLCAAGGIVSSGNAATTGKALGLAFFLCIVFLILPLIWLGNINKSGFIPTSILGAALAFFVAYLFVSSTAFQLDLESLDPQLEFDPQMNAPFAPPQVSVALSSAEQNLAERPLGKLAVTKQTDTQNWFGAPDEPAEFSAARVGSAPRIDTPLGKLLHFSNPLLERELRGRLRFLVETSPGGWIGSVCFVAMMSFCGFVLTGSSALSALNRPFYERTNEVESVMGLCVAMSVVAVMLATLWAAQSFAREREGQMLQTLLLTTLSARDIAGGKRDAALGASLLLFVWALPSFGWLVALDPIIGLGVFGATLGFMALGASCGILCAWLCQSPGIAVAGAAMLTLGFLGVFVRVLDEIRIQIEVPQSWLARQPFAFEISRLAFPTTPDETAVSFATVIFLMFLFAVALLWPVLRGLRPASIEKDGISILTRDLSQAL